MSGSHSLLQGSNKVTLKGFRKFLKIRGCASTLKFYPFSALDMTNLKRSQLAKNWSIFPGQSFLGLVGYVLHNWNASRMIPRFLVFSGGRNQFLSAVFGRFLVYLRLARVENVYYMSVSEFIWSEIVCESRFKGNSEHIYRLPTFRRTISYILPSNIKFLGI